MTYLTPRLALIVSALYLAGCVTSAPQGSDNNTFPPAADSPAEVVPSHPTTAPEPPSPTQVQRHREPRISEIPIPESSVYPLIAAEFALRSEHFDVALALLSEQAMILEDPAVARRALKVAEFRNRDSVALEMAVRLTELDGRDAAAALTAMALSIRAGDTLSAVTYAREAKARGARINAPALLTDFPEKPLQTRQAITEALEALARDYPDDTDIAISLALARREMGTPDTALTILDTVLNRDPDDERALVLWSQIAVQNDVAHAYRRIEASLQRNPDAETLRLQYARLLASDGRYPEARQQFHRLQELSPRNGDYLFSLALIELEADNPAAAEDNLQALLALEQKVDSAHYYLGRIAEQGFDVDRAIDAYRRVGPGEEFFDAKRRAGTLLLDDGNYQGLAALFNDARQQAPGQAERLYLLQADLLFQRDQTDRVLDVYNEALDIFPDSLTLQYSRAMTREAEGDIEAAERDLRAILSREPDNATILNALGYTLTQHTDRYAEAARLIERAIELSPGEAAILDSLGWVYFKLGRQHEALEYLQQAYQQLPDPEVAAHLGETLWALERTEDATAVWRAALTQDPGNTIVTNTLERLGVDIESMVPDATPH